jgi:hypothetical protein
MAKRAIEAGEKEAPFGFIFPMNRRDPNTAADFLNRMLLSGLEVHVAKTAFTYDSVKYPAGTAVMMANQPYRPHLMDMCMPQKHPMNLQYPGGPPIRPYDTAGYTLTEQMGVATIQMTKRPEPELLGSLEKVTSIAPPAASITGGRAKGAYLLPNDRNVSVTATNRLLAAGQRVHWLNEETTIGGKLYPAGTVVVPVGPSTHEAVEKVVKELQLPATAVDSLGTAKTLKLRKLRVGTYDPYGGSMPQGWAQYILEKFEFDHTTVINPDISGGNLKNKVDVLILTTFPNVEDRRAAGRPGQGGLGGGFLGGPSPKELAPEVAARLKGIDQQGMDNLVAFVREGGVLIATESANEPAANLFKLPIRDVTKGSKFYSPGSVFTAYVDTHHPFGWGMPAEAQIYFDNGQAWEASLSFPSTSQGGAFVRYPERNPLISGWIIEDYVIHNCAAAVEYRVGAGRVALFGFDVIFRAQPHLGFKLLFNAIHTGAAENADLK